jgi:tetratricopeptide (TPR) repeat protein
MLEEMPGHKLAGFTKLARTIWWPAALIPMLALVAFAPGVRNGFVRWDDALYILENPLVYRPAGLWRIWFTLQAPQYYPLTFSSYWLEYRLWGDWATGYFLTNLALHAANSALVYLLARALGTSRAVAWVVGALFAAHPLQVASVAWLAQRKNTLCGVFFLLTFLVYLRYCHQGRTRDYVASLLTFLCAMLCKAAAAPLPVSLLLAEWLVFKRRGWGPLRRVAPFLLLALGLGVATTLKERVAAPGVMGVGPQPLTAAAALWVYLGKVLWPATLLALYPRWQVSAAALAWWLPAAVLMAAIVAVWHWRRVLRELPVWGLAHFFVLMLPVLGLVPFGHLLGAPVGDQFVYFGLPGLFLALACWGQALVAPWRPAVARTAAVGALVGLVLLALGVKTWKQVQIWHDGARLWEHTLAHNTTSPAVYNNYGTALLGQGRLAEALHSYRQAVRLSPNLWMAHTNIAIVWRELDRLDEALAELRQVVEGAPQDPVAHFNLANLLVRQRQWPEVFAEYAAAVRLDPGFAEAYTNWGIALAEAGAKQEARARLEAALKLNPDDFTAHFHLGITLASLEQFDQAAAHYEEALRLQPKNSAVHTNLSLALLALGRRADAVRHLRTALELDPNDPLAHLNLGALAAQAGQAQEAEAHFRATLRSDPASVEANNNLGVLLAQQGQSEKSVPYLSEVVRLRPDHANAHYMLGVALAALGRRDEALAHFLRVIALQPTDAEAHEQLAASYAALGRTAEAVEPATQALALARAGKDAAMIRRMEAQLAEYQGNPASASAPASAPATGPTSAGASQPAGP